MDRNIEVLRVVQGLLWSLSARRVWIEIMALDQYLKEQEVALRKESVDRNLVFLTLIIVK